MNLENFGQMRIRLEYSFIYTSVVQKAVGNMYGLLTKLARSRWLAKTDGGQYPLIFTEQAWSIKDLLFGIKHQSMICVLAGQSPYPERARYLHFARSGSQSRREIRFILPAHGARHITKSCITLFFKTFPFQNVGLSYGG